MNRIGFDVSDEIHSEDIDVGHAEGVDAAHWSDGLGEYIFESWIKFCIVYGMFAAIRDLLKSVF